MYFCHLSLKAGTLLRPTGPSCPGSFPVLVCLPNLDLDCRTWTLSIFIKILNSPSTTNPPWQIVAECVNHRVTFPKTSTSSRCRVLEETKEKSHHGSKEKNLRPWQPREERELKQRCVRVCKREVWRCLGRSFKVKESRIRYQTPEEAVKSVWMTLCVYMHTYSHTATLKLCQSESRRLSGKLHHSGLKSNVTSSVSLKCKHSRTSASLI